MVRNVRYFYKQCEKSAKPFEAKYSEIDTYWIMYSQYPGFDFWKWR